MPNGILRVEVKALTHKTAETNTEKNMLYKKTAAVLKMLSAEVGYSYKVVKKQQLLDAMPRKLKMDADELVSIIGFLKDNEYVTVKYQDKDEICLVLTVKAESYLSGDQETSVKTKMANGQAWLLVAATFVAAFLGALLAVLIGKLI